MARIRTIQPDFSRSPSMGRVSRDARLLFVLLWTVVDDEGRCHAEPENLASVLYPADFDAPRYLRPWLDELEHEGCIERYAVDDVDYLRIVHWRKHQWIGHPTQSFLPPSPHERLRGSGIPERSGTPRGQRRKTQSAQPVEERSCTFPEIPEEPEATDRPVTRESVLRDLRRIGRNAEADGAHASALRSVEAMAKIGLGAIKDRHQSYGNEEMSPSPAVLQGLPVTGSLR
jgi:hypothetical protein